MLPARSLDTFAPPSKSFEKPKLTCSLLFYLCCTQNNCILSYNGTGNTGVYAVALQVEDYASASSAEAMSSVPVQFLVEVVRATTPPSVRPPTFVGDTPSNSDCCSITTEKPYELRITAMGGEENAM